MGTTVAGNFASKAEADRAIEELLRGDICALSHRLRAPRRVSCLMDTQNIRSFGSIGWQPLRNMSGQR